MPTDQQIAAAAKAMMAYTNAPQTADALARTRALARVALQAAEQHDIRKVIAHRSAGRRIENAKAAFERRFGKSLMPLAIKRFQDEEGRECVQLTDTETLTWAQYTICNKRVKLIREHDEGASNVKAAATLGTAD
jgi:hypothetical protein